MVQRLDFFLMFREWLNLLLLIETCCCYMKLLAFKASEIADTTSQFACPHACFVFFCLQFLWGHLILFLYALRFVFLWYKIISSISLKFIESLHSNPAVPRAFRFVNSHLDKDCFIILVESISRLCSTSCLGVLLSLLSGIYENLMLSQF